MIENERADHLIKLVLALVVDKGFTAARGGTAVLSHRALFCLNHPRTSRACQKAQAGTSPPYVPLVD